MKIITLTENCVCGHNLQAEHGLSIYIETKKNKILFDTGASNLFIRNAHRLNIDLKEIDYLVLSHGHRDHTGGITNFLAINKKATIICKHEIFNRKFKNDRENGMPHIEPDDRSRFVFVTDVMRIAPGVHVLADIKLYNKEATNFENFYVERKGQLVPDEFSDELVLLLTENNEISVISACSHRGIENIVRSVKVKFPLRRIKFVLGGFHLKDSKPSKIQACAKFLDGYFNGKIGVCHCTGLNQFAELRSQLGDRVFYNSTGNQLDTTEFKYRPKHSKEILDWCDLIL